VTASDPEMGMGELRRLRAAGLVSARGYIAASDAVRDEAFWARWGRRALLGLGAGQLLAGVVFFFAYNWNDLSDTGKFATIETAVVIAAAGALLVGIDRAFGQILLAAASVLTGVLLAVIGQVYQTGADAFELFVAWAVLILPWTIVSRSAAHWLLWLIVADVALALYGEQVLTVVHAVTHGDVWVLVGAPVVVALALREIAVRKGYDWLASHWTRLVLLSAALAILFVPAASHLLDIPDMGAAPLCLAALILVLVGSGWTYWRVTHDLAALVIIIGFADAFFICIGYRAIDETIGFDFDDLAPALTGFGAMILWAIAGTGTAALAMRRLRAGLRRAQT
jgi:uncharacterized membrane protein